MLKKILLLLVVSLGLVAATVFVAKKTTQSSYKKDHHQSFDDKELTASTDGLNSKYEEFIDDENFDDVPPELKADIEKLDKINAKLEENLSQLPNVENLSVEVVEKLDINKINKISDDIAQLSEEGIKHGRQATKNLINNTVGLVSQIDINRINATTASELINNPEFIKASDLLLKQKDIPVNMKQSLLEFRNNPNEQTLKNLKEVQIKELKKQLALINQMKKNL